MPNEPTSPSIADRVTALFRASESTRVRRGGPSPDERAAKQRAADATARPYQHQVQDVPQLLKSEASARDRLLRQGAPGQRATIPVEIPGTDGVTLLPDDPDDVAALKRLQQELKDSKATAAEQRQRALAEVHALDAELLSLEADAHRTGDYTLVNQRRAALEEAKQRANIAPWRTVQVLQVAVQRQIAEMQAKARERNAPRLREIHRRRMAARRACAAALTAFQQAQTAERALAQLEAAMRHQQGGWPVIFDLMATEWLIPDDRITQWFEAARKDSRVPLTEEAA